MLRKRVPVLRKTAILFMSLVAAQAFSQEKSNPTNAEVLKQAKEGEQNRTAKKLKPLTLEDFGKTEQRLGDAVKKESKK